jgi:dipeptidyl aminopeptidase/acylaminoacyl peptidase
MKIIFITLVGLFLSFGSFAQGQKLIIVERDTLRIEIERLGPEVNSEFDDYAPVITADGEYLYFTSRRPYTDKEKKKNRMSQERIYEAIWDESSQSWLEATPLGTDINVPGRNISNVAISNDGQRLLIYQDDRYGNGDIYETYLKGNTWSQPVSLGNSVNSDDHESSASISPDGRTIYFVSERKGGEGKRDIWKATRDKNGNWGKPENLGKTINTKYDEEAVYIHPDGKTLYFSSKGHNSMGGYDIFKSELVNGKWSEPINLGEPINTPEDDLFFVLAANGRTGYYATGRSGGVKNIYQIRFTPIEREEQKEPTGPQLTIFKGSIKDSETGLPIGATLK